MWNILFNRGLVTTQLSDEQFKVWARDLSDLSEQQIRQGLEKTRDFTGYFSLPVFREMCREPIDAPDARQAYREAAMAPEPQRSYEWSHPAIYHAGRKTGWFELRTFEESKLFPLFKKNYEEILQAMANGEDYDIPTLIALPDGTERPPTVEAAEAGLDSLRDALA